MHDPMTVAFEIKYPWVKSRHTMKDGSELVYREAFITIWHVDPESDGSDDSCGWFAPKLTARDREFVQELVREEARNPYYFAQPVIHEERSYPAMDDSDRMDTFQCYRISPGDCVALIASLYHTLRWRLDPKRRKWGLNGKLMAAAMSLGTNEHDNMQSSFAFWEDEAVNPWRKQRKIEDTFANVIRNYRRLTRPWYRHPRWHIRHWQIQVHPWQKLRRWLFTRCSQCSKRFGWNESPIGYSWSGPGPLVHERCTHAYEATQKIIRESQAVA